ncbi:anti-repressor SinI family protein [Fictibacillus phosphorivorans]|uniref:anti-repressor SinI family protein n=1 Tax=Fictibacillus phosphorivorans TaxID=1221500 RepID=UPI0011A22BCD|nr:anti-repressor SinI family protein [Fictibacillus phosphorivorans]
MKYTLSLDKEWIELMIEAKDQGLTKQEIRDFLNVQIAENQCGNSEFRTLN